MIRHGIAAAGLVLVMSAGFSLLGPRSAPDASEPPDEPAAGDAADQTDDPGGKVLGAPIEPPADADAELPDEPDGAPDDADASDPDDTPDEPARIPPASITIQVLDGYREDGGTAAAGVVAELQQFGYVVAAENPAIAYEETTVLWNEGTEAEARQVADDLGVTAVREQPGNLSANVTVHIVVGADRG